MKRNMTVGFILIALFFVLFAETATAAPSVQINWNGGEFAPDERNFYLGVEDFEYQKSKPGKPQTFAQLAGIWATISDSSEQVVWDVQLKKGNVQYRIEILDNNALSIELLEMPAEPTDLVFRVTCSISGASETKEYTIHVVNLPENVGLPTGIEMDFGTTLTVQIGDQIDLASLTRFTNNWAIPGYGISYQLGDQAWEAVGWNDQGMYAAVPGRYAACVTLECNNIFWMEYFTLCVLDENGNLPAAQLQYGFNEWTWYTGLEEINQNGPFSTGYVGETFIPWSIQDYNDTAITWTLEYMSGPDNFVLDYHPYDSWKESYFRAQVKPKSGALTTGNSVYKMKATYKGVDYEETLTIHTVNPVSLPTMLIVKAYKTNDSGTILGEEIPITNDVLTLKAGDSFYLNGNLNGSFPHFSANEMFLNVTYYDGVESKDRWQGAVDSAKGIYRDNTVMWTVNTPGTYRLEPWTYPKDTNYSVGHPITIQVTDENGYLPGPKLDNSGEIWTYYTGLSDDYPMQGGVYGTDTVGQFRVPDDERDYTLADPVWSMSYVSGPDCFELNDNSEHYDGDDINYFRSLSVKGTVTTGTSRYTITAFYNGMDYTADVIVNIKKPGSVPTGMTLQIAEFNENNLSTGSYTTLQNGDNIVLKTGKAYVLEGRYIGSAPGERNNQWLNYDWDEGWDELDRWAYHDAAGYRIFAGYNMVIRGSVPGVYESGATLTIGMSNLEATMPLTLIVTEMDGTLSKNLYTPVGTVWKLPADTTAIESEAFAGTPIRQIDIPAGVTSIAGDAFDGCGLIAIYAHNQYVIDWAAAHGVAALVD